MRKLHFNATTRIGVATLLLSFAAEFTFAQAPVNDNCSGVVDLLIDPNCTPVGGSTANATQSTGSPNPSCGGITGPDDDVWYSFTPIAGQTRVDILFRSVAGSGDMVAQIYTSSDNTCSGSFTQFECSDDAMGAMPGFSGLNVVPGTRYFIRLYTWGNGPSVSGDFTICVQPARYCIPTTSGNNCSSGYGIQNFALNGLNGTSFNDMNTGCSPGGYDDRSAQAAVQLAPGASYNAVISGLGNVQNGYCAIWIDVDNDEVFATSEQVAEYNQSISNAANDTIPILIPSGAAAGDHRMRVMVGYYYTVRDEYITAGEFTPCNIDPNRLTSYEVHDYTVNFSSVPLSIILSSVSATNARSRNRVDWSTAKEDAGEYFELERSADSKNFVFLEKIKGKGMPSEYSYTDQLPLDGINYYRLKLVSSDGTMSYSRVVQATVNDKTAFAISASPNPVAGALTVRIKGEPGARALIAVTDITGKVVMQVPVTAATTTVNMAGLAKGVYLLKYTDSNQSRTLKVSRQ